MRLLILTFSYTPRTNPRATRWTTLAEHFALEGHSVSVVTSWQQGMLEQETRNGVQIFRVGMRSLERLRRGLSASRAASAEKASPGPTAQTEISGQSSMVLRMLLTINRTIWRHLWWPDSTCIWLRSALKTARTLLAEKPADVVISVSPTFSAVVVGHFLARGRLYCRRWIIDLGDPFSFMDQAVPNNVRIYDRLNRWFEKRAFLRANQVSVTTEGTQQMYRSLYPTCAEKITVIPPLLSPSPKHADSRPFFQNNGAVHLVFIGTLYRQLRRPDFLLQLFSAMLDVRTESKCQLHLIGDTHECQEILQIYQERLGQRLKVHAPVDRSLAMLAMNEASILVNLGNETAYQLPSKLIEYAATGKRILNISSLASDSSIAFLNSYPCALCIQDQGTAPSANQVLEFTSFCGDSAHHEVDAPALEEFLRPFSLQVVAACYYRHFTSPLQQS